MSETESILRRVAKYLIEVSDEDLDAAQIATETSLRDDLQLNSLQAITVVLDLEEEFDIEVEDEEVAALQTVGDIVRMIRSKGEGTS